MTLLVPNREIIMLKKEKFLLCLLSTFSLMLACGGDDGEGDKVSDTSTTDQDQGDGDEESDGDESYSGPLPNGNRGCDASSTSIGTCYQDQDSEIWGDCPSFLTVTGEESLTLEQPCPSDGIVGACTNVPEMAMHSGLNTTIFCYNDYCANNMSSSGCEASGGTWVQ